MPVTPIGIGSPLPGMNRLIVMSDTRTYLKQKAYGKLAYVICAIYRYVLYKNSFSVRIFVIDNIISSR